jgi:ATP-dependent DNA ligase
MARRGEPSYYAFDLLWLNFRDLRSRPLLERKRMPRQLIPPNNFHNCRCCPPIGHNGWISRSN